MTQGFATRQVQVAKPATSRLTRGAAPKERRAAQAFEPGREPAPSFGVDFGKVPIHAPLPGSGVGGGGGEPEPGMNVPDTTVAGDENAAPMAEGEEAAPMASAPVSRLTPNIGSSGRSLAHVPACGTQPTIRFTAAPANAAPVTWTLDDGSAKVAAGTALTPAANTLSASLSLGASQKGGTVEVKAESSAGGQMMPYRLASHPKAISSTSPIGDPTDTSLFGGVFDHVFTSNDGSASSLDQVAAGEKFPNVPNPDGATHTFTTPFGEFTLKTGTLPDAASGASGNWFMTDTGELGGDHDTVGIQKSMIDIGRHLVSDSNPTPANPLPAGFTVDQQFFWWCPHAAAGSRWTFAAATTHTRQLRLDSAGTKAEFVAIVNSKENAMDYDGSAVPTGVTNAKADPASVAPSPATGAKNTVQIGADLFPSNRTPHFSIRGAALGCTINSSTGVLTIGTQAGSVKVRVANISGGPNWDEVDVTIATPPAPAPNPNPNPNPPGGGSSSEAASTPPEGE